MCLGRRAVFIRGAPQRDHAKRVQHPRCQRIAKERGLGREADTARRGPADDHGVGQRIGMIGGEKHRSVERNALDVGKGDCAIVPVQRDTHDGLERGIQH